MTEVEQQENAVPETENVEEQQRVDREEAPMEAAAEDGYERQEEEEAQVQEVVPEPVVEKKPQEVIGPLVISEAHENFTLDKKMEDDPTVGYPNPRHIICQFCEVILIPDGNAIKCSKEINLVQNTQREYDLCSTYWYVDSLLKFQNIEVHQMDDDIKYLCCLSCQSAILGFQIIEQPNQIYIACDRVKLEIE